MSDSFLKKMEMHEPPNPSLTVLLTLQYHYNLASLASVEDLLGDPPTPDPVQLPSILLAKKRAKGKR